MVTSLGTTAIAAHFMAIRVASLSYMPAHGLAIAVSTRVGQSLGAQRVDLAEIVVRRSILFGMWFMVLLGVLFVAAPGVLVSVFSPTRPYTLWRVFAYKSQHLKCPVISYP